MSERPHVARVIPRVWDLPQCGATRSNNYANDTPETDRQCKRRGIVEIDGRYLCQTHAGVVALRILLGEYQKEPAGD